MKQLSRAFKLGFACSLVVVGVMAGQSAFGSVADLSDASGSSVAASTGSVSTANSASTGSVSLQPGEVTSAPAAQSAPWSHTPPPPPPLCPVPEANAGLVLAALIPLMLLMTPARLRKAIAAIRAGGAVTATV